MKYNPIICAVDTPDISYASDLASKLEDSVGALKLGLEFFTANGAKGVEYIARHRFPIFLDLKFHDIPNTVARAIYATAGIDSFMMTVHTTGGRDMLRAALDASMEVADTTGKARPLIIGVTILTSLDQQDLDSIGMKNDMEGQVKKLADMAQEAGLDGVVCSPQEIGMLREHCGGEFVLVAPGIRPEGSQSGDQKRTMTPGEAIEQGADYIVVGRPITQAEDPKASANMILSEL